MRSYDTSHVNIQIYPNPFIDFINVAGQFENATYRVYSVDGKFIQKGELGNQSIININNVPSGLYFITILEQNNETVFKVIKR